MNTPKDSTGGCCPPPPCSTLLDDGIRNAATIIIAGFATNGRRNPEWIAEAERIIRREVKPWLSGWVLADARRPKDGDWVLHTYAGVRAPEYGLYRDGRFWRDAGPESFPTTHWLSVPKIDLSNDQGQQSLPAGGGNEIKTGRGAGGD